MAGRLSRLAGFGTGSVIVGRVALALDPGVLAWLSRGRTVVLVSGTNGKTTTSHLLAGALATSGQVAHNASGSNMTDGAVSALAARSRAPWAVLEVDELHLAEVAGATHPAAVVLLNLTRDQLDRVSEVRRTAASLRRVLEAHPDTTAVVNADDPLTVWAGGTARRPVWVSVGAGWRRDSASCPRCGELLPGPGPDGTARSGPAAPSGKPTGTAVHGATVEGAEPAGHLGWSCPHCGLARPRPTWWWEYLAPQTSLVHHAAADGGLQTVKVRLGLPGRVNLANAAVALAAAAELGVDPEQAAMGMAAVREVAGRYRRSRVGEHRVRLLLVKNPAGWLEALELLDPARPLLVVVNAREADGRDVSWLWDLPVESLVGRCVAVAGDRAADLGVRLSYEGVDHLTEPDPMRALERLPVGEVDVVATYTAFLALRDELLRADSSQRVGVGIGGRGA